MSRAHGIYTCHSLLQASEDNALEDVVGVVLDQLVLVFKSRSEERFHLRSISLRSETLPGVDVPKLLLSSYMHQSCCILILYGTIDEIRGPLLSGELEDLSFSSVQGVFFDGLQ